MNEQTPSEAIINVPQHITLDKTAFKGVCARRWRTALTVTETELRAAEQATAEHLVCYNQSYMSTVELLHRKQSLNDKIAAGNNLDSVVAYLQGLIDNRKYKNFRMGSAGLTGVTTPIQITYESVEYLLGCYIIEVGDSGTISIKSETNLSVTGERFNNCCHPHVNSSNSPCLGNISAEVPKLVAENSYGVLMEIMYDFLCSYNSRSPYVRLEGFPRLHPVTVVPVIPAPVRVPREAVITPMRPSAPTAVPVVGGGFMNFVRRVPSPVIPPSPVSPAPVIQGSVLATSNGDPSNYSPRTPTDGVTNPTLPNSVIQGAFPLYISTEADRIFRANGLDPAHFTAHQLRKCNALATCTPESFQRKMTYYINWVTKTNRQADALNSVSREQLRTVMSEALASVPTDGTIYFTPEIDARFRAEGLEPSLFSRRQVQLCRGLIGVTPDKFEKRFRYYFNWVQKFQRIALWLGSLPPNRN